MSKLIRSQLTLAAIACTLTTATARADSLQQVFSWKGTGCVEPTGVAVVPASQVAPFLPKGFEPTEALGLPGMSDVVLTSTTCKQLSVDGATVAGGFVADAGISIASPDGSPGDHFYELWQVSSIPALHDRLSALGVPGELLNGLRWDVISTGPLSHADVDVPFSADPYSFSIDAVTPLPLGGDQTSYWRVVDGRRVRIAYTLANHTDTEGGSQISAAAGSPLAQLIGSTSATGLALLGHFDFTSTVAATPPAAASGQPRPNLLLRVAPRHARRGVSRRFTFTVTHRADGRDVPVPAAHVHFCGRGLVTDAAGRGRMRCTFRSTGVRHAVARADGYAAARATVRVSS